MTANQRAHVIISGRVQGVFFRADTQRTAERLGLKGWVRNRSDGTVEAVFEGPQESVNEAIDWCRRGSRMAMVQDVRINWEESSGELSGFIIR